MLTLRDRSGFSVFTATITCCSGPRSSAQLVAHWRREDVTPISSFASVQREHKGKIVDGGIIRASVGACHPQK